MTAIIPQASWKRVAIAAFHPFQLRSFYSTPTFEHIRLWQCLLLCAVVRQMAQLHSQLKVPLDTAHLMLVQNTPLTIRFLFDEKRFNVEGAYEIRYEIMKKRIDKATIRGTEERLTQPGKIAIVYSHPREAAEYREYIEYLQARGYLEPEIDDVEFEDLQGVQGLRALRVTVILSERAGAPGIDLAEVQAGIQALTESEESSSG